MPSPGMDLEVDRRDEQVATLLVKAVPRSEIARLLDITEEQVKQTHKRLRAGYRERAGVAFDVRVGEQLAKLESLERSLWPALGTGASLDTKVADALLKLLAQRSRLLGLDAAVKIDAQLSVRPPEDWQAMLDMARQRHAAMAEQANGQL